MKDSPGPKFNKTYYRTAKEIYFPLDTIELI